MRKDAGRQAGDNLGYIAFMCYTEHIIIHAHVVSLEETQSSERHKEHQGTFFSSNKVYFQTCSTTFKN